MTADGGVQMMGAAFAHGGDDLVGRKGPVGALSAQPASDSENFITANHGSILHWQAGRVSVTLQVRQGKRYERQRAKA